MSSDRTTERGSVMSRLGQEVEVVGIAPVPDEQRTTGRGKLFIIWAMTTASATSSLLGGLLFSLGLWQMIAVMVVTWVIFLIPCGLFSEMGRELPLSALVVARRNFGWDATLVLSLLFAFVNMAWFGLNCATGAEVLAALSHTSTGPWYWIVGVVDIVVVLFGFKWLEYFYRYTAIVLVVCYAALLAYMCVHYSVHLPRQTTPVQWGPMISTVAGFTILGWTYKVSTISRFAKPASLPGQQRAGYFTIPSIGIMIPAIGMAVIGIYGQGTIGNWNIAVLGASISGWGFVAALGAALGILHTNAMNLYPSTVDLLVSLNSVIKPRKWQQPVATVVLGLLGTLLAQVGILAHAETFISDVGSVLGPFAFVMLVDWLWGLKNKTDASTYFVRPAGFLQNWRVVPIASFLIGFVIAFWGTDFLPAGFCDNIPLALVGSLAAAVVYGLWLLATRRRPAAMALAGREQVSDAV